MWSHLKTVRLAFEGSDRVAKWSVACQGLAYSAASLDFDIPVWPASTQIGVDFSETVELVVETVRVHSVPDEELEH